MIDVLVSPIGSSDLVTYSVDRYRNLSLGDAVEAYCNNKGLLPAWDTATDHGYGRTMIAHDYKGTAIPIRCLFVDADDIKETTIPTR